MADPITSYDRVPPPSNPDSSPFHLDGELSKLERSTASIIARLNEAPSTYATIVDLDAETAARIAADTPKATTVYVDTQDAAEAAARIAADNLKASIVYVDAQDAAETAARIAADALKAPLASPTLTGAPAAPTASPGTGGTQIATCAYADAASPWQVLKKTAAQSVTSSTTLVDVTSLTLSLIHI